MVKGREREKERDRERERGGGRERERASEGEGEQDTQKNFTHIVPLKHVKPMNSGLSPIRRKPRFLAIIKGRPPVEYNDPPFTKTKALR